jgi:hypothetical protein
MNNSFILWHLGVALVIVTVAFALSLKAATLYRHAGLALLSASLGTEALSNLVSFLLIALASGNAPLLLWSSGILRYVSLGLLLGGWISLASGKAISARDRTDAKPLAPMISGKSLVAWTIVAVLVISVLAAAWALMMMFAAGMKTVPRLTGEEALTGALPSLIVLPISIGLCVLGFYRAAGRIFIALGILSGLINLACTVLIAISYWFP